MRRPIFKILSISLIVVILLCLCSCKKETSFSINDFNANKNTLQRIYSFDSINQSDDLIVNKDKLNQLNEFLSESKVEYGYSELFDYDKAMSGVFVDHTVSKHQFSVLNQKKTLTKEALFDCVRRNNTEYLKSQTSLIKDIEDDEFLLRICEIIVDSINYILDEYPDIDKERVYCNLGNLKIIEKTSSLDFAAVAPGMILNINRNTSQMVNLFTGSNMYNVLVHEAMHIVQYGCVCETVEGCTRRCGLAHAYSDWDQDFADWTWLAEGSAERVASLYANVEPMTYKNYVNYLLSLDLVTVLKEDIPANYVETIYFYSDANKLFAAFDAVTDKEKQEIYNMIYSLEIMQVEPADIKEAYKHHYGQEWTDEIRDDINNKVKRPIVKTFTKIFYKNLINTLLNESVSKNDVLFLVNLYESTINYHLRMNVSDYDNYNGDFNAWYREVQKMFFDSLDNISVDDYRSYVASDNEAKTINAGMKWFDDEKKEFLIEKFEDHLCDFKFL